MFKENILYLTFCILSVSVLSGCMNNTDDKYINKEYVLKLNAGIDNPRNSEGDFISLRDGRILFIYTHYTGNSADDHASAFLAGRLSSDGGKTWTTEDVHIVEQEGIMNVMSVSLLRLQNGDIALFYLRKNSDSDCIPMMRISLDEAKTWNAPVRCIADRDGYFVLNNSRVVQLKNGRLLMPVSLHKSPGDTLFSRIGRIWCYCSDDNGLNWSSSEEVPNPVSIITQEPGVIGLNNGDIMMYLRTMSGIQYFSFSKDQGESWSQVGPGNIKSPCSPASITRLPSTSDMVLVWNDNGTDQKRTPFNISYSDDEGRSWKNRQIIEDNPEGSYCYPAIHYTENELLVAYFDWSTRGTVIIRLKNKELYN